MTRLRADLLLLLVAVIWGSAFAVQRVAAQYFDVYTFNGFSFFLVGGRCSPLGANRQQDHPSKQETQAVKGKNIEILCRHALDGKGAAPNDRPQE